MDSILARRNLVFWSLMELRRNSKKKIFKYLIKKTKNKKFYRYKKFM